MFRVTRYPMISKTELGRVGYQKKYRVAGRDRVPAGHWLYRERRWTIGRTGDIKELLALLLHCSSVPCTVVEREDGHTGDVRWTHWGYKGVARTVCHQSHVVDSGLLVAVMQLLALLTLLTEFASFLSLLPESAKATSLHSQAKILFDQDDLIQDSSGSKQDQVLSVPGVIIVFFSGFSIRGCS